MTNRQQDLFEREPAPWELDEAGEVRAASVVFAAAPWGPYDYSVDSRLSDRVQPGCRVEVPLGRGSRKVTGYCIEVGTKRRGGRELKPVAAVLDEEPLISSAMLRLADWMAERYLCRQGQVLDSMVPAGVRGGAGTREVTLLHVPTKVAAAATRLELPAKQDRALKVLLASRRPLTPGQLAAAAECTQAPITALRKKGLIESETRRVQQSQFEEAPVARDQRPVLNEDQQQALDTILRQLRSTQHRTVLVHGVTGSGKTEVYMRAIEEVVSYGRQAIVLVPEISLTPQTRSRFRARFDNVAVLHSHQNNAERHWHWKQIAQGKVQVVVGARSAVFAPLSHLGLIVLDEEHESSFKQDSAPRYHARDVAIERARAENVPLVLGSATPSLESWHHASTGQYELASLPRRVLGRPLPDVATIDLRSEFQSRQSRGAISRQLHQSMALALKEGGQVILLLNRRGFSTHIQCPACGEVVMCPDCELALTYHRDGEKAVCHYCDHLSAVPKKCPGCGFDGIRFGGLGTQRLEAEVRARFRDQECLRMDTDTMRSPGAHEKALDRFRHGEVQILLGTQMIAKGLDFPGVTLVGVVNADTALHLPDFRAGERTFQLVTQVAGRTGRGEKGGRVLVQTFSPDHPAIVAATKHDYAAMARYELPIRRQHGNPPFVPMIRAVIRGPVESDCELFAGALSDCVKAALPGDPAAKLLGPGPAPIMKLRNRYRYHLLASHSDGPALRAAFRTAEEQLDVPEGVQWIADVDPHDMM